MNDRRGESGGVSRRTLIGGAAAGTLAALLGADAARGVRWVRTTPATTPGTTATGGSAPDRPEIDELRVGFAASLANLYPGKEAGILNYYVVSLVSEGLVAPDADGNLVPALAASWSKTSPTTYVYTLRPDARFSDGVAVTVDDVLYSIKMAKDDKISPNTAYYWSNLASAEATGDHQITLTLSSPDVAFEWGPCASNALWVTAQRFVDANTGEIGTPQALLYGTGPYRVTKFEPDSMVELERVDTWWGGHVPVKKVHIDFITEESTRILARQSGDIDLAINISLDQVQEWQSAGDTTVLIAPDRSYVGIDFNTAVAPFDDIHVRRAIALACDRQGFVTSLLGGHGEVATALTTPEQIDKVLGASGARAKLAEVLDLPFDLDQAKAELAKSTVPTGFTTKVGISSSAPQVSQAFQSLKQTLAPLGIVIEIQEMPVEQWFDTIGSKDWGLAYMMYSNTTGDPAELASWFFGDGNPASYANPALTAQMAKVKTETDPAARIDLLVEAQKLALADLPYVPLWWGVAATAIRSDWTVDHFGSYSLLSPWTQRIVPAR